MPDAPVIRSHAPGRVNLIGEHTDYVDGLALPMAIDLGTTVDACVDEARVRLQSAGFAGEVDLPLAIDEPAVVEPAWGRYVAGVVAQLSPRFGIDGQITTTIPVGTGLSSSAALELAVALALQAADPSSPGLAPLALAQVCQRAEQQASGVPCGLMDQLTSAAGVDGHALLIDFRSLVVDPVPVPEGVEIVVIHSGQQRELATSAYAERRAQLEAAADVVGPLRDATVDDLGALTDPVVAARARHVVTENARVLDVANAFRTGDLVTAGQIMTAAHASFRDDFAASTDVVDALVARLVATDGVFGARLTGGGFGGCVVALAEPAALTEGWIVHASAGASATVID